jgi:septal ring factor EnvC (AmiA/AmiB activator)
MNKVLHVLVYVFLALAAAALWFELQLNAKRSVLTDRNRQQEDYFVKVARMIEKAEPDRSVTAEPINMDVSPVEARIVDSPDMENVLDGYNAYLEAGNLETYNWTDSDRQQLRAIYQLDAEGKPIMDLGQPKMDGPGTASELLERLLESSKAQLSRLNSTRAELQSLRGKLSSVVAEVNRIKPGARQDKVNLLEKEEKVKKLEGEKADLENQVTKIKGQIDELNQEIASLKDEVVTAKDETEAVKEELAKAEQRNKTLEKLVRESIPTKGVAPAAGGVAITSLPAGDKGVVIEADNENMFAIVKFTDEALKELKGDNLDRPIPFLEISVKRPGFNGPAGEFVGRLRLRQEVKGKPYVVCDILGAWEQDKVNANDVIFAD